MAFLPLLGEFASAEAFRDPLTPHFRSKFGAIVAQIFAFKLKDRGGAKNAFVPHILEIFALFM